MSKLKSADKKLINYKSSGRNRTYSTAMPVQWLGALTTEVAFYKKVKFVENMLLKVTFKVERPV